jgi:ABC-type lipoprotein release transport system permease subunit
MKLAFRLAFKNLMGAGLRTWLNVSVLSFTFVIIIFYSAFINGWQEQARIDGIEWEYGQGQLLNEEYDPYDPFSIIDGHGILPENEQKNLTAVLVRPGSIYPDGRMVSINIKGIDVNQDVVKIPTHFLKESTADLPAVIGTRMAKSANLKVGDEILIRWRDKNGTYDATNITIAGIFNTTIATVDNGQIWISLVKLRELTGLKGHTSYFISNNEYTNHDVNGWKFADLPYLLKDLSAAVEMERAGSIIIFLVLLSIALLAVFDTQVLSIFRRQKEIGTYIALGMTRVEVVKLFTVEGSMYAILAILVGSIYGIPLFIYTSVQGISLWSDMGGDIGSDMGISIANIIHPVYTINLIAGTISILVIAATVVSFMPARKISNMSPVNALKGKLL